MRYEIYDDTGLLWIWDGRRVYLLEAEEEVGEENGYPASSVTQAYKVLFEGGYISENTAAQPLPDDTREAKEEACLRAVSRTFGNWIG